MKPAHRQNLLTLEMSSYDNYIREIGRLESIFSKRPRQMRIDLIGSDELSADSALLLRSILLERPPRTRVTTRARTNLQGAAVLIWLLGDTRLIREDARLFIKSAGCFKPNTTEPERWQDRHGSNEDVLEEIAYVRVLQHINEFLPVRELADRPIDPSVLRQFGLLENLKVDRFLAAVFRKPRPSSVRRRSKSVGSVRKEPRISI
jgi:hypothetical protein